MTKLTGAAAPPAPPDQHPNAASATLQGTVAECRLPGKADDDTLPRLYSICMLDDADGIDPPFPMVTVDDSGDLNTPGRLRAAAVQYRELGAKLDAIADGCRLPGLCQGTTHQYDHCTARLVDIAASGLRLQVDLERDLPSEDATSIDRPCLQVWIDESGPDGKPLPDQANVTITRPADAHALADALEAFAAGLRRAGDTLGQVSA